jgi:putative DNA primase/helicase
VLQVTEQFSNTNDSLCFPTVTKAHQDDENAIQQVRAFLEQHGGSRFQEISDCSTRILNRAGFKRTDAAGQTEYLILTNVFKSEMCRGYDDKSTLRLLEARGCLVGGDGRNLAKRETVPELGRIRVYLLTQKIFDN